MKLAFYYHIPVYITDNGDLLLPGYLGVFVDALAKEVDQLTLVMHTTTDKINADYALESKNVKLVNLGAKTPAWHRMLFHKKILRDKLREIEPSDILLVRSPSPLAPYFYKYLDNIKLNYLIVGDYKSGAAQMKVNNIRDRFIQVFLHYNNYLFKKQIRKTDIFVNSPELAERYKRTAKSIGLIKTTTLSEKDFFKRKDTCTGDVIRLLYTGRMDPAKGLSELLEAFAILKHEIPNIFLHYAGWEDNQEKPVETNLKKRAKELNIEESVTFHGRKNVGEELNAMYQMADIYIIPSYHEGFPRTIWEAMANSLPVIATKVGSIPYYLENREHALLIDPKNIDQIVDGVKEIIQNPELGSKLIASGQKLAKENTLEKQSKILVDLLSQLY